MATVCAFSSSSWPNFNPNSNPTSASDSDSSFLSHNDRGDATESLEDFCSLRISLRIPIDRLEEEQIELRSIVWPSLQMPNGVLPKYFSSDWSVAQFRLVEGPQYIVAFGHEKNTVVILGMDGSFCRCQFDPVHGGEMSQLEYHNCLKPPSIF